MSGWRANDATQAMDGLIERLNQDSGPYSTD